MAVWYLGSTKWTAVTAWAALTSYSVGDLRRQLATPTVGEERVFRCTTAGISGVAEPAPWTLTKGGTTTDATAVWTEVTGDTAYGWTAAHARLANAFAWMAAGDTVYVSQASAETQASAMTLTSPGTAASPCSVLCVDDSATPPTALATTATVATTGASAMTWAGFLYSYGVAYTAGSGASSAAMNFVSSAPWGLKFDTCALALGAAASGSDYTIGDWGSGDRDQYMDLINTTVKLGEHATSNVIFGDCRFTMRGGAFVTTSTPTSVIVLRQAGSVQARFIGVDLSIFASGKALVTVAAGNGPARISFEHCKLGASVSLTTGTHPGPGGPVVWMDNCDSGDTQTRMQRAAFEGDVYSETTIVRTGGASDGVTPMSHKLVSGANVQFLWPLYGPEMWVYNSAVGSSKTVTVEIVHDSVTALTDAEAWLEVEYLGTSGFPLALFANDRAANILATPADQTASSVAWTTTGITNVNKQKLAVTITPQEVGIFRCRVALAKASKTIYADPLLTVA